MSTFNDKEKDLSRRYVREIISFIGEKTSLKEVNSAFTNAHCTLIGLKSIGMITDDECKDFHGLMEEAKALAVSSMNKRNIGNFSGSAG